MSIGNFYRGDTKVYNLTFTENGAPKDISNLMVIMTLKSSKDLLDASASMQVKYTFPANANSIAGIGTLTLTSVDTNISPGKYYYDIQLVDSSGGSPVGVTTLVSGTLDVLPDITRDTA